MIWRILLIGYIAFCMVVMGIDVGAISEHKGLWLGSAIVLFVTTLFGFMAGMEFRKHRDAWDQAAGRSIPSPRTANVDPRSAKGHPEEWPECAV